MKTMGLIKEKIANCPEGVPITSSSFLGFGSRASVDQALSRLVREGALSRVARGVFTRPKRSRYVGEVPPDPFYIAKALADASGAEIEWHGAEAARRLGITTQMPAAPVFLTTGSSRKLRMGKLVLELRHVAPRKLHFAGRPAGQALSALWYLGNLGVTPEVIRTIKRELPPEEYQALAGAHQIMPGWMSKVFREAEEVDLG